MKFIGNLDIDREVLLLLNNEDMLSFAAVNKYMFTKVCDDTFFRIKVYRINLSAEYKHKDETWKRFYLRFIYYKNKMKKYSGYQYISGDFAKQDKIFNLGLGWKNDIRKSFFLFNAAGQGELDLVKHALVQGAKINPYYDNPLVAATRDGHLEIVKFLLEKGAENKMVVVETAISNNKLDILKYLTQHKLNFALSFRNDIIIQAAKRGRLSILKYLFEELQIPMTPEIYAWAKKTKSKRAAQYIIEISKIKYFMH